MQYRRTIPIVVLLLLAFSVVISTCIAVVNQPQYSTKAYSYLDLTGVYRYDDDLSSEDQSRNGFATITLRPDGTFAIIGGMSYALHGDVRLQVFCESEAGTWTVKNPVREALVVMTPSGGGSCKITPLFISDDGRRIRLVHDTDVAGIIVFSTKSTEK